MRAVRWVGVGVLVMLSELASGQTSDGMSLPLVQARVRLGMSTQAGATDLSGSAATKLSSASMLGDYYFARSASREGDASGFRATSGVFIGSRLGMWGGNASGALGGNLISVERHSLNLLPTGYGAEGGAGSEIGPVPYLGLGYSGSSLKGGWGFSADLGLMALSPGNAMRLGRAFGGGQSLDDLVRELRLSPMLQFGVSYSF